MLGKLVPNNLLDHSFELSEFNKHGFLKPKQSNCKLIVLTIDLKALECQIHDYGKWLYISNTCIRGLANHNTFNELTNQIILDF